MLKVERRCCSITSVNRIIPYNKERGRLLIHIPFNEAIASINLPARYGFCTYLASKVIKAAKYIGMNLLQSLYCTHVFIRHQIAFNQRVCFLLASSVNTGCTFLSIRCFNFQLVSDAHELNTFFFEFLFQPSPIVSCLHIIRLLINGTNDIDGREPPFGICAHLAEPQEQNLIRCCNPSCLMCSPRNKR